MCSVDDMRSCIQEWFADASDPVEVAKIYHVIVHEAEEQLMYRMEELEESRKS